MGIRRLVTAQRADGTSVFAEDAEVEAVQPLLLGGNEIWELWGDDGVPQVPTDGTPPTATTFFPAPGGYRMGMWTIAPTGHEPPAVELDAGIAEAEEMLPGVTAAVTDKEGQHVTDTIDLQFVLEGTVTLRLDSGEEKDVAPGSLIVQNGTNHQWLNRHETEWVKILSVFVGAERNGD
jgi:quercetin dioxygenase-like cupin family protein